jgi:hypothetical protein
MKDMLPAGYWLSSPLPTSMAIVPPFFPNLCLDKKSLVALTIFQ